jgi:DNA-binding CsgD family transcriptional regulator
MSTDLTPRQISIIARYASGLTGPEIAAEMYLSLHTVRNYLKAAKRRSGAKTLAQLVAWCIALDVLDVAPDGSVTPALEK